MIFLTLLFSTIASAACSNLKLNLANGTVDLTSNTAPALNFTVQRSGLFGCNYFVTVDYGGAASFNDRRLTQSGGYEIPVDIYRDVAHTQLLKKLPEATVSTEVIAGSFPNLTFSPSSVTHTYYPQLATVDYHRFGEYSDTFTVRLYEGTLGSGSPSLEDSETVKLKYTMAKKIDLSLVATGAPFNVADTAETMNFGTLTAGAVRTFDIGVKFNAGYRVRVSSLNQGNLKHASQNDTVPYTLRVNSSVVNLAGSNSSPVQVSTGSGVSPTNGLALSSSVTIGALGNARAGNYSDTVTVTVVTTE